MGRRYRLLVIGGLAALVLSALAALAIVPPWFDSPLLGRETASPQAALATSTVQPPSPTRATTRATPTAPAAADTDIYSALSSRPLDLPVPQVSGPCPTSKGSRETVPEEPYIFGAGGVWFGRGPVYMGLSWHDDTGESATFSLDPVPYVDGAYSAKTPWVARPEYSGPVVARGQLLDGTGKNKLRFEYESLGPLDELRVIASGLPAASLWSFWPTSMLLPGPGCYGVQIDTLAGTDVIVFEATRSAGAPGLTPTP